MPVGNDPFWIQPSLRLVDPAVILHQYDQRRNEVFTAAQRDGNSNTAGGNNVSQGNENVAWEEAWSRLQETLKKT